MAKNYDGSPEYKTVEEQGTASYHDTDGISIPADNFITLDLLNQSGLIPKNISLKKTYPLATDGAGYSVGSLWLVNATTLTTGKINSLFFCQSISATTATTPVYTATWKAIELKTTPVKHVSAQTVRPVNTTANGNAGYGPGSTWIVANTTSTSASTSCFFVCLRATATTGTWVKVH